MVKPYSRLNHQPPRNGSQTNEPHKNETLSPLFWQVDEHQPRSFVRCEAKNQRFRDAGRIAPFEMGLAV